MSVLRSVEHRPLVFDELFWVYLYHYILDNISVTDSKSTTTTTAAAASSKIRAHYFHCEPNHGMLVALHKIRRVSVNPQVEFHHNRVYPRRHDA